MKKVCQLEWPIRYCHYYYDSDYCEMFPSKSQEGGMEPRRPAGRGSLPPASHRSVGAARLPSALVPLSRGGLTSSVTGCELVCLCVPVQVGAGR